MRLLPTKHKDVATWGTHVAADILFELREMMSVPTFSLRQATEQCYRMVGVAAVVLYREPPKVIDAVCAPSSTDMFAATEAGERATHEMTTLYVAGMMSFVHYANRKLDLQMPKTLTDLISQLFAREAAAFYDSASTANTDVVIGLLSDLSTSISFWGPHKALEIVTLLREKLVAASTEADQIHLAGAELFNGRPQRVALVSPNVLVAKAPRRSALDGLLERRSRLIKSQVRPSDLARIDRQIRRARDAEIAASAEISDAPF